MTDEQLIEKMKEIVISDIPKEHKINELKNTFNKTKQIKTNHIFINMNEILRKIGKILLEEQANENADVATDLKTTDVVDKDGVTYRIEGEIAVDSVIKELAEDETLTDVKDGEIELPKEAKKITVAGGKITEIKDIEAPTEPAKEAPTQPAETAMSEEKVDEVAEIKEKLLKIEAQMSDFLNKFTQMKAVVEVLAAEPASEPVKLEKTGFSKNKEEHLSELDKKVEELRKFNQKNK